VPDEDIGSAEDAGGLHIFEAYPTGPKPREFWSQDTGDVTDQAQSGDRFGFSLASVDWMSSDYVDLAIGVPGEDFTEQEPDVLDAGAVHVLAGDIEGGLTEHPQAFYRQSGLEQAGARFGHALAAGNLVDNAYIAVGAPYADVGTETDAGSVTMVRGSVWTQDSMDVLDQAEAGDNFGSRLAGVRTTGDHRGMLAIGVTGEDVETVVDAGAVAVLYAPWSDFDASDNQFWHQDSPGIAGAAEQRDRFGASLA
jgi:hypothetical protein